MRGERRFRRYYFYFLLFTCTTIDVLKSLYLILNKEGFAAHRRGVLCLLAFFFFFLPAAAHSHAACCVRGTLFLLLLTTSVFIMRDSKPPRPSGAVAATNGPQSSVPPLPAAVGVEGLDPKMTVMGGGDKEKAADYANCER